MNGSTVVFFSFADADAFSNSDFFGLPGQFNTLQTNLLYRISTSRHTKSILRTITVTNITFVEAEEIGKKVVN